ncbi:MAG: pyruvate kinase [Proteobacteria bacterium]|jgi:pyruvate kinase|nr:pyruvate kinase [Pseudomonadota bacterium]
MEQKVKIVATLGPASDSPEIVRALIAAGADVFRLNFSHGTHEGHRRAFDTVRAEAGRAGVCTAVLADLCGPKIRIGEVAGGGVPIATGDDIELTTEKIAGDARRVSTTYRPLPRDVKPGARILLDDGLLELEVASIAGELVRCRVIVGGVLKSHKGMNIPGTPLSTPAMTDKDREDLAFARELGVDYAALSFVRRPEDVLEAKALAGDIPVIAKIEKPEAIASLDAIIAAADGIMVARGDLGVEAGAEQVPLLQKRMVRDAVSAGKPVIVATQMLDSMIHNPRPTRAEVSDVANAVLDGTDAVMLSGETASGAYPVEAVREMAAIIREVEASELFHALPLPVRVCEYSFSNAIARAAVTAAAELDLKALAVYTETGHSAALASSCRPNGPALVGLSRHDHVLRRLNLRWGIRPIHAGWVEGVHGVVMQAEKILLEGGFAIQGDDVGITFGMQDATGPGRTDVLKLWRIKGQR